MSLSSFEGLAVRLDLADGAQMEGIISTVDESSQLITLSNVSCLHNGSQKRFPGLMEVFGADICNIELLSAPSPPVIPRPKTPLSVKKGKSGQKEGWAADDVRAIKSQDFDFASNLQRFDKQKIFSEIQAEDKTDRAERLVSHNLSGRQQEKFKHTESVLGNYDPDDEQEERIIHRSIGSASPSSRSIEPPTALLNKLVIRPKILLRTPEGISVDPSAFSRRAKFYHPITAECTGMSLASHISERSPKSVTFMLASNDPLSIACYTAARHLIFAGVSVTISNTTHSPSALLKIYLKHYSEQLSSINHAPIAAPHESLVVNATASELVLPIGSECISLDYFPTRGAGSTTVLLTDPAVLNGHEVLERLHPRSDMFLLNTGAFDDPLLRLLFDPSTSTDQTIPHQVRLFPHVK